MSGLLDNRVRRPGANPQVKYGSKYGPTCHQWYHAAWRHKLFHLGVIVTTSVARCWRSDVMALSHYKCWKSALTANPIDTARTYLLGLTSMGCQACSQRKQNVPPDGADAWQTLWLVGYAQSSLYAWNTIHVPRQCIIIESFSSRKQIITTNNKTLGSNSKPLSLLPLQATVLLLQLSYDL